MKIKHLKILLTLLIILLCANSYSQQKIIKVDVNNAPIQYEGRIGFKNPGVAEIYWPGSSCKIKFKGTELKTILKDERGHNYYNVIIDGNNIHVLKLDTIKREYTLASQLQEEEHTVELFRRTGWTSGLHGFMVLNYHLVQKFLSCL